MQRGKMQKVTAILPSWDKTKTTSKTGFDKGWKLLGESPSAPLRMLLLGEPAG